MKIEIEYCASWNYLPHATSLVAKIREDVDITEKLIPSSGGVFEVKVNGKLIFSKRRSGRFPEKEEIVDAIKNS